LNVIGIVGCEAREKRARALFDTVIGDLLRIDREPWESLHRSMERCSFGHLMVLSELAAQMTSPGWVVVLEDDAVPVQDFRENLDCCLGQAPTQLVSLYLGTGNPSGELQRSIGVVRDRPEAWIISDALFHTVGYAIHGALIDELLTHLAADTSGEEIPKRITAWSQQSGYDWAYSHPSLVDHEDADSTIYPGIPEAERRKLPRRAHQVGVRTNWVGSVWLPPVAGWSRDNQQA
jgi:hypothetical protein